MTRLPRLGLLLAVGAFSAVFYINFCDLVFQCGCRSLWNGLAEACNIHDAGSHNCPWCSYGYWGYLPLGGIVAAQALVTLRPGETSWRRALLALVQFPLVGGIAALAFGWYSGYWS